MRKSSASWKSRSVSSGRRRNSSHRAARCFSFGSSASALSQRAFSFVPVKNLLPGPEPGSRTLSDVFIKALEIGDAMRRAGDVGMHADRRPARALRASLVEAVEGVDAAAQPFFRGMVLQR